eukprot:gene4993-34777_t
MMYDVSAALFRSFLAISGGHSQAMHKNNRKAPGEAMPVVTAASMSAVQHQVQACGSHNEVIAMDTLKKVVATVHDDYKVPAENVHTHLLPAVGGASGVAESIIELVKVQKSDLLGLGCRGMGGIKRACMAFIGLGSVSDYCLHNCGTPTLVVRFAHSKEPELCAEASPPPVTPAPKKVVVSTDGSINGHRALSWALDNVLSPADHLYIISASCTSSLPFIVPQVLDEPSAVAGMQAQEFASEMEAASKAALAVIEAATEAAMKHGVLKSHVTSAVVQPAGAGSSDLGAAICKFAADKEVDAVVIGCRGLGAISRNMMGMLGLGSVSEYVAHNSPCPVLVIKSQGDGVPESQSCGMLDRVDEENKE